MVDHNATTILVLVRAELGDGSAGVARRAVEVLIFECAYAGALEAWEVD